MSSNGARILKPGTGVPLRRSVRIAVRVMRVLGENATMCGTSRSAPNSRAPVPPALVPTMPRRADAGGTRSSSAAADDSGLRPSPRTPRWYQHWRKSLTKSTVTSSPARIPANSAIGIMSPWAIPPNAMMVGASGDPRRYSTDAMPASPDPWTATAWTFRFATSPSGPLSQRLGRRETTASVSTRPP